MPLLRDLAHARSGDKTGSANIGVVVVEPEDVGRVGRALRGPGLGQVLALSPDQQVLIHELPRLGAFNVELPGVLGGAPGDTLAYDVFGHDLGARILALQVDDA